MKAFTAAVSLVTAWVLYRLTPQILALPGADELREANRTLQREVASRRQAEGELTRAKAELELRVGTSTRQAEHTATVLDRFFEEAPLGMAVLDADLQFIRVNPALTAVTVRACSAYLGHSVEDATRFPSRAAEAFRQVARRGKPQSRVEYLEPTTRAASATGCSASSRSSWASLISGRSNSSAWRHWPQPSTPAARRTSSWPRSRTNCVRRCRSRCPRPRFSSAFPTCQRRLRSSSTGWRTRFRCRPA